MKRNLLCQHLQHCMFVQCLFLPRFLGAYVTLLKYAETTYPISTKRPSSFVHTRNDFKVIKELLAKGAVVESLDLKEAPDILAQAGLTTLALTIPDQYTVYMVYLYMCFQWRLSELLLCGNCECL